MMPRSKGPWSGGRPFGVKSRAINQSSQIRREVLLPLRHRLPAPHPVCRNGPTDRFGRALIVARNFADRRGVDPLRQQLAFYGRGLPCCQVGRLAQIAWAVVAWVAVDMIDNLWFLAGGSSARSDGVRGRPPDQWRLSCSPGVRVASALAGEARVPLFAHVGARLPVESRYPNRASVSSKFDLRRQSARFLLTKSPSPLLLISSSTSSRSSQRVSARPDSRCAGFCAGSTEKISLHAPAQSSIAKAAFLSPSARVAPSAGSRAFHAARPAPTNIQRNFQRPAVFGSSCDRPRM